MVEKIVFEAPFMFFILLVPFIFKALLHYNLLTLQNDKNTLYFPYLNKIKIKHSIKNIFPVDKIITMLLWCCISLILMRPIIVNNYVLSETNTRNIMLAVDLSRSMSEIDAYNGRNYESRINAAKNVVRNFVKKRLGDKLGLVVFAENAYITVPLTFDIKNVDEVLKLLLVGMAGDATAIGDALVVGTRGLIDNSKSESIMILLTDGDDTASHISLNDAIKIAKQHSIRIFTIGMGSSNVDEGLLKEIAVQTGGKHYLANDKQELSNIYSHINKILEKSNTSVMERVQTPIHQPFIVLMLILIPISYYRKVNNYA